jgi:hypothetical protein
VNQAYFDAQIHQLKQQIYANVAASNSQIVGAYLYGAAQGAGDIVVGLGKELGARAADFANDLVYLGSNGQFGYSNLNLSTVSQLQAEGRTTTLKATLASLPFIGNGYNAISGTDLMTGQRLDTLTRAAAFVGLFGEVTLAGAEVLKGLNVDVHLINCFVAGTDVLLGDGTTEEQIQDIQVGQRVATDGGVANSADGHTATSDPNATEVDPATWRLVTITAANGDWQVQTLVPLSWIEAHHLDQGSQLDLSEVVDLAEMGVPDGLVGTVVSVAACPTIAAGDGRVVTTTVSHSNDDVYQLTLQNDSGRTDTMGVTAYHRVYTEDRGWVDASDLALGELVRGDHGDVTVTGLVRDPGSFTVYNITVEGDHVYYVGDLTALVHNDCGPVIVDSNLPVKVAEELRGRGVDAIHVSELFGADPGDAAIRAAARDLGARVISKDLGRDFARGGGVGFDRYHVPGPINTVPEIMRYLTVILRL